MSRMFSSASCSVIPRSTPAKNGSLHSHSCDSVTTSATVSVRCVTSVRAAWFGTYPSSLMAASTAARVSSATLGEPLMTRETVPRPTPAWRATVSRVGRPALRPRFALPLEDGCAAPVLGSSDRVSVIVHHLGLRYVILFCLTIRTSLPHQLAVPLARVFHDSLSGF